MSSSELFRSVRDVLSKRAASAASPFLPGEPAFVDIAKNRFTKSGWGFMVLEDEYLPERHWVERTNLYAYSAGASVQTFPPGHGSALSWESGPKFPVEILGFPPLDAQMGGSPAYLTLSARARRSLRNVRDALFLEIAEEKQLVASRLQNQGGLVIRYGPLGPYLYPTLSPWLESRTFDLIVGVDITQPDLTSTVLYKHVAALVDSYSDPDSPYRCRSDALITSGLAGGERTGLFWRHRPDRIPSDSGFSAASCYARLDTDFPVVRFDFVGRAAGVGKKDLSGQVAPLLNFMSAPLIAARTTKLGIFFHANVPVPLLAEPALDILLDARENSPVRELYAPRMPSLEA